MSSEQGPREAGMRAAVNAAGRRRHGMSVLFSLTEAAGMSRGGRFGHSMSSRGIRTSLCITGPHAQRGGASASREQGPREAGMRPSTSRSRPPGRTWLEQKGFCGLDNLAQRHAGGDRREPQDADGMACRFSLRPFGGGADA